MALSDPRNRALALTWSADCGPEEQYTAMILRDLATCEPRNTDPADRRQVRIAMAEQIDLYTTAKRECRDGDAQHHALCVDTLRSLLTKIHTSV